MIVAIWLPYANGFVNNIIVWLLYKMDGAIGDAADKQPIPFKMPRIPRYW